MPAIQITRINDNPHETTLGIRDDTSSRGVDLAGAVITAVYADGTSETLIWQAFDAFTFGGATGANVEMSFGFDLHQLIATKALATLKIDLAPASSVFDTTKAMDDDPLGGSTPTSKNGFPFIVAPESENLPGSITATYSGVVNLAGSAAVGDLYTTMTLDFAGLPGGGLLGDLTWNSDIDTMRNAGDLVPLSPSGGGTAGNDFLTGTAGADVMKGLGGDDTLDGLTGTDTAGFDGAKDAFTLRLGSTIQVQDRIGAEGTDTLRNIELLDFGGDVFDLFRFDDVSTMTSAQFSSFTEMYIAYFNRAPDSAGLMFWANAFATGTSLEEIARFFASSVEAQALYPSDSPSASFVEAIYLNVLGRASDADGAAFWTSVLENGSVTRSEFVLEVLRGARADPPPDASAAFVAQQQADQAYLGSKIDVGIYFSAILGMSDLDNARAVMALYDGSPPSIAAAKAAADQDFATAQSTGTGGEFLIQLIGVVDDPFL